SYPSADQAAEITATTAEINRYLPGRTVNAFRTPWCDSAKSFDNRAAQNLQSIGITSDSSVPVVLPAAAATIPMVGAHAAYSVSAPAPFVAVPGAGPGKSLVEFPRAYPSDYM